MKSYFKPTIFSPFKNLITAQSTRHGGVSVFPYASLNLGLYTDDSKEHVKENRRRFFDTLAINEDQVVSSYQVHKDQILNAATPGQYQNYDALVTNKKNLFLTIKVADCVPILIYDSQQQVVATAHAGWRGSVLNIVAKLVDKMSVDYNTIPSDCYAYIGTCIDQYSFEVNADVADEFDTSFKRWDEEKQKYFVDLKKANLSQLTGKGIPKSQIEVSPFSTVLNNENYFSYRKEKGQTGRMLAVIGMV